VRLTGTAEPDGLVVTSPVTSVNPGAYKPWVRQIVFSNDLDNIKIPVLVVVHAEDQCIRTPPVLGARIIRKTNGAREQAVTVTGGAGRVGDESVKACKGRSPHGFIGQEEEVAAGIARFTVVARIKRCDLRHYRPVIGGDRGRLFVITLDLDQRGLRDAALCQLR